MNQLHVVDSIKYEFADANSETKITGIQSNCYPGVAVEPISINSVYLQLIFRPNLPELVIHEILEYYGYKDRHGKYMYQIPKKILFIKQFELDKFIKHVKEWIDTEFVELPIYSKTSSRNKYIDYSDDDCFEKVIQIQLINDSNDIYIDISMVIYEYTNNSYIYAYRYIAHEESYTQIYIPALKQEAEFWENNQIQELDV